MSHAFLTPKSLTIANEIIAWANSYLVAPNEYVHRPGKNQVVCPYVEKSLSTNRFYMAFHPEVNGQSEPAIETILLGYIEEFLRTPPFPLELLQTKALLVVFPELPERDTGVLDLVFDRIKPAFVGRGLMVGQFHTNCRQAGVHNGAFLASKSPHPLIAIRHMALHDILFLENDGNAFKEYDIRFNFYFREPDKIEDFNKHLIEVYRRAKTRWAR